MELDPEESSKVTMSVIEAGTNAIQHGSSSPADVVRVTVMEHEGALVFEVRDIEKTFALLEKPVDWDALRNAVQNL